MDEDHALSLRFPINDQCNPTSCKYSKLFHDRDSLLVGTIPRGGKAAKGKRKKGNLAAFVGIGVMNGFELSC